MFKKSAFEDNAKKVQYICKSEISPVEKLEQLIPLFLDGTDSHLDKDQRSKCQKRKEKYVHLLNRRKLFQKCHAHLSIPFMTRKAKMTIQENSQLFFRSLEDYRVATMETFDESYRKGNFQSDKEADLYYLERYSRVERSGVTWSVDYTYVMEGRTPTLFAHKAADDASVDQQLVERYKEVKTPYSDISESIDYSNRIKDPFWKEKCKLIQTTRGCFILAYDFNRLGYDDTSIPNFQLTLYIANEEDEFDIAIPFGEEKGMPQWKMEKSTTVKLRFNPKRGNPNRARELMIHRNSIGRLTVITGNEKKSRSSPRQTEEALPPVKIFRSSTPFST